MSTQIDLAKVFDGNSPVRFINVKVALDPKLDLSERTPYTSLSLRNFTYVISPN